MATWIPTYLLSLRNFDIPGTYLITSTFRVRTHRFANMPEREAYTIRESIGARRIDELNRELENALQSYSLQLTEAFARNF